MTTPGPPRSIDAARRAIAARLREAGVDTPELDARLLAGHVFHLDLTGLTVHGGRMATEAESAQLETSVSRRLAGEPIARIVGMREFWGLPLRLSAATLVPRPDTETVVETALRLARDPVQRIADLGTGSGALLLALLKEWPGAFGVGTDLSESALRTARDNAIRLDLADRSGFVLCDQAGALNGPFDLIVANPPYIPSGNIAGLDAEVREHDPHLALDGGPDGLDAYRKLIPQAERLLRSDACLVVEVGIDQDKDVADLMRLSGLCPEPAGIDLGGVPRAVAGRKMVIPGAADALKKQLGISTPND